MDEASASGDGRRLRNAKIQISVRVPERVFMHLKTPSQFSSKSKLNEHQFMTTTSNMYHVQHRCQVFLSAKGRNWLGCFPTT